ncbi:alpha/beta hydrolase family protein [Ceratobasidium sp. AG-Ba]|nr:alpha/beta hydrolase family protein [Ceratobasidium sp. AG-Ba]
MKLFHTIIHSVALAAIIPHAHSASASSESIANSKTLTWKTCSISSSLKCAKLVVPFDYQNPSAPDRTFELHVAKLPARQNPKRGSIFMNFGGPGIGGVDGLSKNKRTLQAITEGYYDIISWDPRGVPSSVPQADCFASEQEESAFWEDSVLHPGLEAPGKFESQADIEEFLRLAQPADQTLSQLGEMCKQRVDTTLPYVGTAATVRDMIAIHNALGGSDSTGKINYWGFSYGTLIGLYLVNMFPDRAGRVVLEGVVDPEYWANKPAHESWSVTATHLDAMLGKFASECVESDSCSYAKGMKNEDELLNSIQSMITLAYNHKKQRGSKSKTSSAEIRKDILDHLPCPSEWDKLSQKLYNHRSTLKSAEAEGRSWINPTGVIDRVRQAFNSFSSYQSVPSYAFQAITCGDASDSGNVETEDMFKELVRVAENVAPIFGPAWGEGGLYCHKWPYRAVERYAGPWNKRSPDSEPILVIGNSVDSVTPYESAQKVAHAFEGKAILIRRMANGHLASWNQDLEKDTCTSLILRKYFMNGTSPTSDVTCEANQDPPFRTTSKGIYKTAWATIKRLTDSL